MNIPRNYYAQINGYEAKYKFQDHNIKMVRNKTENITIQYG
jgi:hypothetical protein